MRYSLLACVAAFAICLSGAHATTQGNIVAKISQKDAMALSELEATTE